MNFPEMPKLSERLKYIRTVKNLSQAELATKAGTTQQAIQQAENGKARQPRYLHQLAQGLDVPIEWMMFGKAQEVTEAPLSQNMAQGLEEKSSDVLDSFYAMPEKDQQLIYELMQSRKSDKE